MTDNDATQTRRDDADVSKELRRTLDDHGVKWKSIDFDVSKTTLFYAGSEQYIFDDGGGIASPMLAGPLTPAQVIAATLGAGTCTLINAADDLGSGTSSCMCFKCGYTALDDWWEEFNFCPNCGRRIEVTE